MNKLSKNKRTITNPDDLKNYLTKDKLNEFKRHINDYILISKEVDNKIDHIKKQTKIIPKSDIVLDEYDISALINTFMK
jgi:hypothetical protein